jgi:hypothetical protein
MENIANEIDERQETLAFPSPSPGGRRVRDEGPNQPPKTNHRSPVGSPFRESVGEARENFHRAPFFSLKY